MGLYEGPIFDVRMPHLRNLTLSGLMSIATCFVSFFRGYRHQLIHISLADCSIGYGGDSILPTTRWVPVIQELSAMPNLSSLRLERLAFKQRDVPKDHLQTICLERDMTTRAIWNTSSEVEVGLTFLAEMAKAVRIVGEERDQVVPTFRRRPCATKIVEKDFLDMRSANFKAAPVYTWTSQELKASVPERSLTNMKES